MQPTVSARDVHTFLDSARDFTSWAKHEVARCSLEAGVDYERRVFTINGENPRSGRPAVDFVFTLPAAKKIGMSARGHRGDAVREYFIEQERRFLEGEPPLQGSVPPARQLPADRPAVVDDQPIDPLFMSLASYLVARGLSDRQARREATAASPVLAASMIEVDAVFYLRLVPGLGWTFTVPFLDEWWGRNRTRLLSAAACVPPGALTKGAP
jgi:phage anti-repressor protein